MRTIQLVGAMKNGKVRRFARRCAWCRAWASSADYIAAHMAHVPVSHIMCERCAKKWVAEAAAIPQPPAA